MNHTTKSWDEELAGKLRSYAETSGYRYAESGRPQATAARIFNTGYHRRTANIVEPEEGQAWRYFSYGYSPGLLDFVTTERYFVLEYNLGLGLPQMIVSVLNSPHGFEELELEGPFAGKRRLSIAPGSQIAALQIMTPDVMELMMGETTDFDIEFADTFIVLYDTGNATPARAEKMIKFAQALAERIKPEVGRMNHDGQSSLEQVKRGRRRAWIRSVAIIAIVAALIWGFAVLQLMRIE